MKIQELFKVMVECAASDLYLRSQSYPRARINGKVEIIDEKMITQEEMLEIAKYLLSGEARRRRFAEKMDIDFIHEEPHTGRFRLNIFMQRGTPAVVARHVHTRIKSFTDLGLPAELFKNFCEEARGLVLVCGPAGNGKSTAIASMIEHVNLNHAKHIITIEDPIEFLFEDKKSLISQRELESDVLTYPSALKHITQQSPDIIFIGNIRDVDTMRAAITATELGTFVLTTFHTINAVQTVMRILNFFPPHLHEELRHQLAVILKGTISLRLLPRKDGQGRIPAFETMVVTPTIAGLLRDGKIQEIQKYIDEGDLFGMQSFKRSLVKLVKAGLVEELVARSYADSKDEFDLELKGIKSRFE